MVKKNSLFQSPPEKGALSPNIPITLQGTTRKMGIFGLKTPFSGATGKGSFLASKPSFPDFGDFGPCRGSAENINLCCLIVIVSLYLIDVAWHEHVRIDQN